MLGLPDATRACLFDLDGVLTDTASVHAAAWKQMFDDFLRARAQRTGEEFVPFDVKADYGPYVDGKPRLDGTRGFLASRGITLPDGDPADGPDAETVVGLATRKNELVHEKIRDLGVDVYPGSVRYLHAVRDAGLTTAVVSSSANAELVLQVAGLTDLIDHRVDGVVAKQRAPAGQARARHVPRRRGRPRRAQGARRGVRGRHRRRGVRPRGRVRLRRRGGPRSATPTQLREHGADVVSPTSPTCWRRECDEPRSRSPVHRRALGRARARARHGVPRRHRDGLRAVQRPHRPARQPRRGGAARHAGHLPQLLLRAAAAAVRRGRLRLPGVRPDDHQRHQRQDHPAAGGRRAVRPALRPAAPPPARARPAVGHADPRGPVEQPGGQDGQGAQRAAGLADPARGRRDLLRGRGRRRVRADRRAVRAGGQRAAADDPRGRPAGRGRAAPPAGRRAAPQRPRRRDAGPPHPPLGAARGRGDGPRGPRARGHEDHLRGQRGHRADHGHLPPRAGHRAAGGQVPGLRLVVAAVAAGGARPGPGRARRRALHGLGRAARRAARLPRRVLDHRGRRDRRRRRAAAGGARRGVPRAAGRRPGRAPGDRGQGPDRPRLRRPHLLGHRDLLPAGAQPPAARRGGGRPAAGASRSCRWPASGPSSWAWAAQRSRGARSAARSARATGRPGRRRSTSTPTSPTPCGATC